MASFAAASSWHPLPTQAVGEVIGDLLDSIGSGPDLAVLFVGSRLTGALDDIVTAVQALLRPVVLLGTTAPVVLGGTTTGDDGQGLVLWAGVGFDAEPVQDPTVDACALALATVNGTRLVLDDRVLDHGTVGVAVDEPVALVLSHAARTIGEPFVATAADDRLLLEVAGRPALSWVERTLERLEDDDRSCARRGLALGCVVDDAIDPSIDDLTLVDIAGGERARGAIALSTPVEVGTLVQLVVHDPEAADRRLRRRLGHRPIAGALVFTTPDRDPAAFAELLPPAALAGVVGRLAGVAAHPWSTVFALF